MSGNSGIDWIERERGRPTDNAISLYKLGIRLPSTLIVAMDNPEYVRVGRDGTVLVIEPCERTEITARKVSARGLLVSTALRAMFDAPNGRYAATVDDNGRLTAVLS